MEPKHLCLLCFVLGIVAVIVIHCLLCHGKGLGTKTMLKYKTMRQVGAGKEDYNVYSGIYCPGFQKYTRTTPCNKISDCVAACDDDPHCAGMRVHWKNVEGPSKGEDPLSVEFLSSWSAWPGDCDKNANTDVWAKKSSPQPPLREETM